MSAGLVGTRRDGRCEFRYIDTGPLGPIVTRWLTATDPHADGPSDGGPDAGGADWP